MLFNSIAFLFFFPTVAILFFALPHRFRWAWLLAASCAFYMAFVPVYILILLVTILIDYVAGIWLESTQKAPVRKAVLLGSILSTCLVLGVFKYFNFFATSANSLAAFLHIPAAAPLLSLVLPIGLSFHTFQSLSYVIEVYRGHFRAERHLGIYSLYVMFFPQLVAGPIERPQNVLHQFREVHRFDAAEATAGLRQIAWGLFKKVVIADQVATVVNFVYHDPAAHSGPELIIATLLFAVQIYCDFSGYSDVALGTARIMGFRLMTNFDHPYSSRTVSEFWRRWHISLSTWFRDYVYVSLGGNRVSPIRRKLNLLTTFVISGLWHGANWTYVIWGALNGLYQIIGISTSAFRERWRARIGLDRTPRFHAVLQKAAVFALISFAWIFFRATTVGDAFWIVGHLGTGFWGLVQADGPARLLAGLGLTTGRLAVLALVAVLYLLVRSWNRGAPMNRFLADRPVPVRWAAYLVLGLSISLLGTANPSAFIYFQF